MTDFYVLTNEYSQTYGIFTSPEKAMEYVYLAEIYQCYRGYKAQPEDLIWEDSSGISWYARTVEDFHKPPMNRGMARYQIHLATLDQMPPVENELREFAQKRLYKSSPVVAYGSRSL